MAGHPELDSFPPNAPIFSDAQYKAELAKLEPFRTSAFGIMQGVRLDLIAQGLTTELAEVYKGWKRIDCYFPRIDDPDKIIHLQLAAAKRSSIVDVMVREMDREKMLKERERVSAGDEHAAVIRTFGPKGKILCSHDTLAALMEQVLEVPKLEDVVKQPALAEIDGQLSWLIEQKHQQNLARRGYYLDFLIRSRAVAEPKNSD